MRRVFGEALCTVFLCLTEVEFSQQLSVWVPPMQLIEERDLMSQIESDHYLLDSLCQIRVKLPDGFTSCWGWMNKHKWRDCLSLVSTGNQAETASATIPCGIACDQKHCRGNENNASQFLDRIFCWCKLVLCHWNQLTDADQQQLA